MQNLRVYTSEFNCALNIISHVSKVKMSITKVVNLSKNIAKPLILVDTELVSKPILDQCIGEGMGNINQHP